MRQDSLARGDLEDPGNAHRVLVVPEVRALFNILGRLTSMLSPLCPTRCFETGLPSEPPRQCKTPRVKHGLNTNLHM